MVGVRLYLVGSHGNQTLPNHAMMSTSQFTVEEGIDPQNVDYSNRPGIWCQVASFCGLMYQWYGPKGLNIPIPVPNSKKVLNIPAVSVERNGQVGLIQNTILKEGLYHCDITENTEIKHTLVVGVYGTISYNENSKFLYSIAIVCLILILYSWSSSQFFISQVLSDLSTRC